MSQISWSQIRRQVSRLSKDVSIEKIESRVGFKVEIDQYLQPSMFIKDFDKIEDVKADLATLYMWLWSMKDYLTELLADRGTPHPVAKKMVNAYVNKNKLLQLVADVANTAKHAVLKNSRSGQFASIGGYSTTMPLFLKPLPLKTAQAEVKSRSRSYITLSDNHGKNIGDAVEVASKALTLWQSFVDQHRLSK